MFRGHRTLLYLPDNDVPGGLLQECTVGGDGGEQGLAGALADGGPRVHAHLAQLGVETEPEAVEGRRRVEGPVERLALLQGLFLQHDLLPLQLVRDGLSPLEEVVRDVPLQGNEEEGEGEPETG